MLKPAFIFLLCILNFYFAAQSQQQDSMVLHRDTIINKDTLGISGAQPVDSVNYQNRHLADKKTNHLHELDTLLSQNIFLRSSDTPVSLIQSRRKFIPKDMVFYGIVFILFFLGIIKVIWPRYFNNLIRVFFNTSLRQGQLTDQLLQAKLPSLFFNIFFVLIAGWYLFLLLAHSGKVNINAWNILALCTGGVLLTYTIKFITLRFAGWLTGYNQEAETYTFIVFLINKMIAICLVPIIVIIPFSRPELVNITVIISYVIVIMMFLMRFFRSYGLLQHRLKISGFHFLLYIIGIEVLPILLIYKVALVIISKSL